MTDVRVGLIGWGKAARGFHAPLIRATAGMRLAAVGSRNPAEVADSVRTECGAEVVVQTPQALLAGGAVDLVVVATPNDSHHEWAAAALRAGCHVVVDKPFALDLAQARELVALAGQMERQLCVFHNRRWDGDFLTLRRLLASGELGRVTEFVSHFDRFRPQRRERWRERAGPGAGIWMDLGPHLLDQALQLFGPPAGITLDLAVQRAGPGADDWFDCRLRWDDGPHGGLRARLHAGMLAACARPRFVLLGDQAAFRVDGLDPQEEALSAGRDPTAADWGRDARCGRLWHGDGRADPVLLEPGAYPRFYAALREALHDGQVLPR
ncbi:oxidoreductase [Rubrivivax gelatinosus]|uniref:oxidoreductase n=1 Tax=Rubrivivax gelatinosus TaxID=28068 RepID=UPI001F5B10E6|nr:oxidoreductase [Rubrivivax gelatinosus]